MLQDNALQYLTDFHFVIACKIAQSIEVKWNITLKRVGKEIDENNTLLWPSVSILSKKFYFCNGQKTVVFPRYLVICDSENIVSILLASFSKERLLRHRILLSTSSLTMTMRYLNWISMTAEVKPEYLMTCSCMNTVWTLKRTYGAEMIFSIVKIVTIVSCMGSTVPELAISEDSEKCPPYAAGCISRKNCLFLYTHIIAQPKNTLVRFVLTSSCLWTKIVSLEPCTVMNSFNASQDTNCTNALRSWYAFLICVFDLNYAFLCVLMYFCYINRRQINYFHYHRSFIKT